MATVTHLYAQKLDGYFDLLRTEILPFLPTGMGRVLELGCGSGNTLRYLKANGYCRWAAGIELFPEAADEARRNADVIYEANIEGMDVPIPEASLDAILCLDVLEHLVDPYCVVKKLHRLLRPGGFLLASIPNVCHYSASMPLLLAGRWRYKDSGILDRTHLRFFVRETAIQLMSSSGLVIDRIDRTYLLPRDRKLDLLSAGLFRHFFEYQLLIRARNQ